MRPIKMRFLFWTDKTVGDVSHSRFLVLERLKYVSFLSRRTRRYEVTISWSILS